MNMHRSAGHNGQMMNIFTSEATNNSSGGFPRICCMSQNSGPHNSICTLTRAQIIITNITPPPGHAPANCTPLLMMKLLCSQLNWMTSAGPGWLTSTYERPESNTEVFITRIHECKTHTRSSYRIDMHAELIWPGDRFIQAWIQRCLSGEACGNVCRCTWFADRPLWAMH